MDTNTLPNQSSFKLIDLVGFFLGFKKSIIKAAKTRYLFWVACLFIVSAGLARNYDHHLLLDELLWIGGPFIMAFFSATFIFSLFYKICDVPKNLCGRKLGNYRAWLRCFLLTAPMAWLYGIPYESMMDILPATVMNFATLIVVSIWRVYLMTRVVTVLFQIKPVIALLLILLPASFEMGVATIFKSLDIVGIMGGMRLSPKDEFLLMATSWVSNISWILFFVSLLGVVAVRLKSRIQGKALDSKLIYVPAKTTWSLAVISIIFWLMIAQLFQPKLQNKQILLSFMRTDNYDAVVTFLQGKRENDFPKGHALFGSRYGYQYKDMMELLSRSDELPSWVKAYVIRDLSELMESGWKPLGNNPYAPLHRAYDLPVFEDVNH